MLSNADGTAASAGDESAVWQVLKDICTDCCIFVDVCACLVVVLVSPPACVISAVWQYPLSGWCWSAASAEQGVMLRMALCVSK